MKKNHYTFMLPFIMLILSACSAPTPAPSSITTVVTQTPTISLTPEPTITATATQIPTETPTVSPTPTPPPPPEIQYVITAEFEYTNKILNVAQFISVPNNSSTPLNEIMLVIPPNLFNNTFHLNGINWDNGEAIVDYNLRGSQLYIPLSEPLNPGEVKNIILYYDLWLPINNSTPGVGPTPFGYTTRQVNLVDWYPFVPPYTDGQGWITRDPWAYGEFLVYPIANFDINITLKNLPQPVTIAASAPDIGDGETHKYSLKGGRNFVWSISPSYTVFEEQVNGTTLMGYVFLPDAVAGEQAFYATVDAFKLFTDLFGPYPHPMLTMVQADFDHGMEYQSLYFLNRGFFASYDGTPGSFLIAIAAHETSHQWWHSLVANDQALEPWLDEAMATYCEYLFYEYYYPEMIDEFWWERRVNPYFPAGWVNSSIYSTSGYREYRDAVYLQGAIFLNDLRIQIGDEAFFAFLRDYADTYANQFATGNDFFRVLANHTNVDLSNILTTYFQR
jgi:hypothetical protein